MYPQEVYIHDGSCVTKLQSFIRLQLISGHFCHLGSTVGADKDIYSWYNLMYGKVPGLPLKMAYLYMQG